MRFTLKLLFVILLSWAANTACAATPNTITKDSSVVTYHDNGEVKEKGKYRNGEKHGKWKTYNENGILLKVVKYKKGVFWWEHLYKNGKLSQITDRKGRITKMKDCGC